MAAWSADLSRVAGTVPSLPSAGLDKAVAQIAGAVAVIPEMQVPRLVSDGTLGAVAEIAESLRLTERRYSTHLSEWSSALSGFQDEIAQVAGAVAAVSSVEVPRLVGTTLATVSETMEASGTSQITGAFDGAVSAARSTLAPLQEFASQTADWAAAVAQVEMPDLLSEGTRTTLASAGWALDSSQLAAALANVELFREQFKATNPFDNPAERTSSPITEPSLEVAENAGERLRGADADEHHRLAAEGHPRSRTSEARRGSSRDSGCASGCSCRHDRQVARHDRACWPSSARGGSLSVWPDLCLLFLALGCPA